MLRDSVFQNNSRLNRLLLKLIIHQQSYNIKNYLGRMTGMYGISTAQIEIYLDTRSVKEKLYKS